MNLKPILNTLDMSKITLDYLDDHINFGRTYLTGIDSLDQKLIYKKGTVNLIGGRTSEGKTRFLFKILLNFLMKGYKVYYVTAEDTTENIYMKMLEQMVKFDTNKALIKSLTIDNVKSYILQALKKLNGKEKNLSFVNSGQQNIQEFVGEMERCSKIGGEIFIYDYLQTISVKGSSTYERHLNISEIFRQKTFEFKLCSIGVVQLNRQSDATLNDAPPSMATVAGSGHYEDVSHSIILIKRKRRIEREGAIKKYIPTNDVELYVEKNRLTGRLGMLALNKDYQEVCYEH